MILQQIEQEREAQPMQDDEDEESDSSDDGSSYHEDVESSEEEACEKAKGRRGELEWDDSTLNF